jgi:hypothetical protein
MFFAEAQIRVDSLFKACAEVLGARNRAYQVNVAHQSKNKAAANDRHLDDILDRLVLAANPVAIQCFGHVDGATERAIANIAAWMAYLPQDCVSTMVRDGWH